MIQSFTNMKRQKLYTKTCTILIMIDKVCNDLLVSAIIYPLFEFLLNAASNTSKPVAVLCSSMHSVCEPLTSCWLLGIRTRWLSLDQKILKFKMLAKMLRKICLKTNKQIKTFIFFCLNNFRKMSFQWCFLTSWKWSLTRIDHSICEISLTFCTCNWH